ncbi:MAG: glutathione S-transferase family protein [Gammaproteobacteria bacterium]|nr:glutathione S-transferase family protein [Gammaproteobacteria bacterium]MDP2140463.1 glutathione S-transferase family protein [Gammaproteobacteria bacterium]MDP2349502.1 glutathione S-transferase family protein [Gammaproteobacteria bacterium]
MLKFYYAPKTCALAAHIALEHIGAPYEAIALDFANQAQRSADYLAINPKGRVPALATERGILTETPALLMYLAQRYPEAKLAPLDDIFTTAQMQAFNSYLCSTVHVAHAHRVRGARWVDDPDAIEAMKKKVPQTMGDCMALIEYGMLKGPWVMGEQYTVADMYLYTISGWLEGDGVDLTKLPRVIEHRTRMAADPVVKRITAIYQ